MKKKIAIMTLNGYYNFGNRLQNYAVQSTLESLGFTAETILVDLNDGALGDKSKVIKKRKLSFQKFLEISTYKNYMIKLVDNIRLHNKTTIKIERSQKFKDFTKTYIKETEFIISNNSIPERLSEKYDYFIVGSDQVWNPLFGADMSIYFLGFAPQEKRIAFAPSFGAAYIPEEFKQSYRIKLLGIPFLSVREKQGADIIHELTGKDAVVLVDPTMLLNRDQWLNISRKSELRPSKKYLLTYFLGSIPQNIKLLISQINKDMNYTIINLANISDPIGYMADPSEFIDYISGCEIFLTDSFHGAVFSILFEKPFVVFDRVSKTPSMNSRIDTLLSKFKLESRKWENISKEDDVFKIDFSHVPPILQEERAKAYDFLRVALNVQESEQNES